MKLKDTVKPNGHYKPNYDLVESRVTTNVKYDAEEHKEELIEKTGVRKERERYHLLQPSLESD